MPGIVLEPLQLTAQKKKMLHRLMDLMDNTARPLHNAVTKQGSVLSQRLQQKTVQEVISGCNNNHTH